MKDKTAHIKIKLNLNTHNGLNFWATYLSGVTNDTEVIHYTME